MNAHIDRAAEELGKELAIDGRPLLLAACRAFQISTIFCAFGERLALGLGAIDLFCGSGGSSLAFRCAAVRTHDRAGYLEFGPV